MTQQAAMEAQSHTALTTLAEDPAPLTESDAAVEAAARAIHAHHVTQGHLPDGETWDQAPQGWYMTIARVALAAAAQVSA